MADNRVSRSEATASADEAAQRRDRLWEAAAIVGILLVAAAFRLIGLASLPPGLFQDEAVYGVNAEVILGGVTRIYFGEREPFFEYLVAPMMLVLGRTPLAVRATAALTGVLGVAAGGAFARQLFGRKVGLLTAAAMAASLWLTALSRVGFRAITFPTVECLGLALLWRATRTGRYRDFALGGAVLGLCLYTYLASRFLPFALIAFVALGLVLDRNWMRKQLPGFAVAAVLAVLVCLPLGLYALRHPEMLMGRPDQVALPSGSAFLPALIPNIGRTFGMLVTHGDENWRQNFSGAPVFDPLNTIVFIVGLVWALRWRRPASLLVLALLVVMMLPSALSIDSPHYLRTEGAAVASYTIWALGLVWLAQTLARAVAKMRPHPFPLPKGEGMGTLSPSPLARGRGGEAVLAIALIVALVRTGWTYFVDYARDPAVFAAFNANVAAAGEFLANSPIWRNDRASIFVTDQYYLNRGSIGFFLYPYLTPTERPHWLDDQAIGSFFTQDETIPLPVAPSVYVVDGNGQLVLKALGPAVQRSSWIYQRGSLASRAIWAAPAPPDWFGQPVQAQFGRWLELERVLVDSSTVGLRWKIRAIPPYQPSIFVHALDAQDHTLAVADQVVGFSFQDWRVGQEFVTWHAIHLPAGTLPGQYRLTVGVYQKETGAREPAVQGGAPVVDVAVGALSITRPVSGAVAVSREIDRPMGSGVTLVGFDLAAAEIEAGGSVPLTLVWQATGTQRPTAEAQISIRSATGSLMGNWRGAVGSAAYPSSQWPTGTLIRQIVDVPVIATASGPATLGIAVGGAAGQPTATIDLSPITIKASSHQFTVPRPAHPLSVEFAGVGTLIGYDLPDHDYRPGEVAPITLYWRSSGSVSTAYTVFAHLLSAQNQVVGQRDEPPVHGSRPTTGWVAGEYVVDEHDVPIDPGVASGTYQVEIGLYDPRTGQRVATGTPDNRVLIGSVRVGTASDAAQR